MKEFVFIHSFRLIELKNQKKRETSKSSFLYNLHRHSRLDKNAVYIPAMLGSNLKYWHDSLSFS